MKKGLVFYILIFSLLTLTSCNCNFEEKEYEFYKSPDLIEKIDIINPIHQKNGRLIEHYDIIKTINSKEEIDDFISEFSKLKWHYKIVFNGDTYVGVSGNAFIIYYDDENYEIIHHKEQTISKEGKLKFESYYCDKELFEQFLINYM